MLPTPNLAGSEGFARGARGKEGIAGSIGSRGGEQIFLRITPRHEQSAALLCEEAQKKMREYKLEYTMRE